MAILPPVLAALVAFSAARDPIPHPVCSVAAQRLQGAHALREDQIRGCSLVAWRAWLSGVDVPLAVELAWSESRWVQEAARADTGARGLLGVVPRWWCPGGRAVGCDLTAAGLRALRTYQATSRSPLRALCRYKGGTRCSCETSPPPSCAGELARKRRGLTALAGARRVLRRAGALSVVVARLQSETDG